MNHPELLAGGTTPIWALPYPSPSDPVAAGAANIQALAEATERALTPLSDVTLAAPAAAFDLTSIPQTHVNLVLTAMLRLNTTNNMNYVQFNGDTVAANYMTVYGIGGTLAPSGLGAGMGWSAGTDAPAGSFTTLWLRLFQYRRTDAVRIAQGWVVGYRYDGTTSQNLHCSPIWVNIASAVNRLKLSAGAGSYVAGSRVQLFGEG
jgi:hypothetical protein